MYLSVILNVGTVVNELAITINREIKAKLENIVILINYNQIKIGLMNDINLQSHS